MLLSCLSSIYFIDSAIDPRRVEGPFFFFSPTKLKTPQQVMDKSHSINSWINLQKLRYFTLHFIETLDS